MAKPYRWYFIPGSHQVEDRWNELVALCSVMDAGRTNSAQFDAQITSILDVEQFLRVIAARTLHDDWDCIGIGNGQNAYVYYAPMEGRWKFLPWDMDHTFGNNVAKLFPEGSEAQITRLVQRPAFRRAYLRIVEELLQTAWNPSYIGPYLSQTQSVMGGDGTGILNFITSRRPSKPTNIGTFIIPSNWSGEYTSTSTQERLRGTAPTSMAEIVFVRNEEQLSLPISWAGVATWSVQIPIQGGENRFEILGFSDRGELLGSFNFRVISSAGWLPPVVGNVSPNSGPVEGGIQVKISGDQFRGGARVFFGPNEATLVTVVSLTEIRATAPAGTGKVAVRVTNVDAQSSELAGAFEYLAEVSFLRGDPTLDGRIDISDPIKILGYLFLGDSIECLDAADFDNNNTIDISDPIAALNFLFSSGNGPAAPYPLPGPDPDLADKLGCAKGI